MSNHSQNQKPEHTHSIGPEDAEIHLEEYADFECPFCVEAAGSVPALMERFGDRIRFTFHHYPLTDIHEYAELSAIAAEAAAAQGKFWEMHQRLFEDGVQDEPQRIMRFAEELGLDRERFANDLKSPEIARIVQQDIEEAERKGVDSTPTFFLNGEKYDGPSNFESLRDLIQDYLENRAA